MGAAVTGRVTGWFLKLDDKPEDAALWRVLVVMADAADPAGGNIRLTTRTITDRAGPGPSRATVRRRVEDAQADPSRSWAIEVVAPGGPHRATVYRFRHYQLWATPATAVAHNKGPGTELWATGGPYMGQSTTQNGPLRATPSREMAQNVFTSLTYSAGPAPDPRGVRSGATVGPAVSPEPDAVGRAEAVRYARDALAAACDRCDDHGWIDHGAGAGEWCDHQPTDRR